jgi:hypothetical protein
MLNTYARVVGLVARSHPVFAFRLDSSSTKKRLAFPDQYLLEALRPLDHQGSPASEFAQSLRQQLSAHAERDAVAKLEESLLGLARRVSIFSLIEVHLLIRERHKRLKCPPIEEIDRLLTELVESSLKDPQTRSMLINPAASPLDQSEPQ